MLINAIPSWGVIAFFVIFFVSFAWIVSYLSSHAFSEPVDIERKRAADNVLTILGSGYGILLGFIVVALWGDFLHARQSTEIEAGSLVAVIRNSAVFPEPIQKNIINAVGSYVKAVTQDEWIAMRTGQNSVKAFNALNTLFSTLQAYSPQPGKETIFYTEVLQQLNASATARHERLGTINSILPAALRLALILGGILLVFLTSILESRYNPARTILTLSLAGLIGFNLALAISFDYPFSGDISVSNAPFHQDLLAQF